MKGIHQFAANLLSYIPAKYYWNQSTSDLVIAKSRRVNFFWNTVYIVSLAEHFLQVNAISLNRKVKPLNKIESVCIEIIKCFAVSKSYNTCSNAVFRHWYSLTIVLPLVYIALSMIGSTLFAVSPEIRCSGVSSRYCCYGNHTAGSKPI